MATPALTVHKKRRKILKHVLSPFLVPLSQFAISHPLGRLNRGPGIGFFAEKKTLRKTSEGFLQRGGFREGQKQAGGRQLRAPALHFSWRLTAVIPIIGSLAVLLGFTALIQANK